MKPLYQDVADDILNKIMSGEYPNGTKLDTEIELALKYNVSRVTMRKAMEILVNEKQVYRISGKGTFVGTPKHYAAIAENLIGVILCNFSASYGTDMLKSLERNISANNYSMVFANSYYNRDIETKAILSLAASGVKGIIIQPVHNEDFNLELMKLSLTGFPFVLIDRNLPGLSLPFVGTDNAKSIIEAMKYIFSLGHSMICMFTPQSELTSTIEDRIKAFDKAFVMFKGNIAGRHVFSTLQSPLVNCPTEELIEKDIKAIEDYLTQHKHITCAFASEYSVSRMIRTAAKNLGLRIPEDLSIITFDNHNDSFRKKETSFIRQDEEEIGRRAVELLIKQFNGEDVKGKYYVDSEIVAIDSLRKV